MCLIVFKYVSSTAPTSVSKQDKITIFFRKFGKIKFCCQQSSYIWHNGMKEFDTIRLGDANESFLFRLMCRTLKKTAKFKQKSSPQQSSPDDEDAKDKQKQLVRLLEILQKNPFFKSIFLIG